MYCEKHFCNLWNIIVGSGNDDKLWQNVDNDSFQTLDEFSDNVIPN